MENKIKAYLDQLGGKMSSTKASIVQLLFAENQTIESVSKKLNISLSTATARLSDLSDEGVVKKISTEGRFSEYRLADVSEVPVLRKERLMKRFAKWQKQGVENGWLKTNNK